MAERFNVNSSGNELPEEINPTEDGVVEIKQLDDSDGDFYPKTHVNAVDGIEKYDNGIIGLTNDLIDFANTIVSDTGWVDYSSGIHKDVKPNLLYSSSGFHCGIRQVLHYYGAEDVKYVNKKMLRVNMRNFAHDQQIAQLPSGFMKTTQVFWARGGNGYQPIMVQVMSDGKVIPRLMVEDVDNNPSNNWIYAQFEWTE